LPSSAFFPFASEMDWALADWMVSDNIPHGTFNHLLCLPGLRDALKLSYHNTRRLHQIVDSIPERAGKWSTKVLSFDDTPDEKYYLRHRDALEAICGLWRDLTFKDQLVYVPERVFNDKDNRVYNEMWTGQWWEETQDRLPYGATIAPVIIATDKTQLTMMTGGKVAYPMCLTIGNLPKSICRRPSMKACILVAYLPVEKVPKQRNNKQQRSRTQRVFHKSMCEVLKPLIQAGKDGVLMAGGDGAVHRVHPIVTSHVSDYPEQCLSTCTKYGTCPRCRVKADSLASPKLSELRTPDWVLSVMADARQASTDDEGNFNEQQYFDICMESDVSGGVYHPFWEDLPHCNIFACMTGDELDACISRLPPCYGVRHFKNGISKLSQVSGPERKQIGHVLLACLVGKVPRGALVASRALLDFAYIGQYGSHDEETLHYLGDALDLYHDHMQTFVDLGCRKHLNIPKFHVLHHWLEDIPCLSSTDNYNTEMFEHLHIDFAKKAWRASNHRDEFPQMVRWLSRQEKMQYFHKYIQRLELDDLACSGEQEDKDVDAQCFTEPCARNPLGATVTIAKYPPLPRKSLSTIETSHSCPSFSDMLKRYLNSLLQHPQHRHAAVLSHPILFDHLDVFTSFKLFLPQIADKKLFIQEVIKAKPR
ncbi:hypothetical protein FISHEDRAFT_20254, partial [Fistulina hepatica ATCC 64428]